MNKHVTAWLAAYYDRQLDPQRLAQVEAHLQVCPECRHELQSLDALSALLSAWEAPFGFTSPQAALDQLPARTGAAASSAQRDGL
ncbi:MAG TPA: zf-HC2 domain-containing protein, partial [Anaerolineales bacterium]|nr:zf-HC2 domain-containing protein [Anaerolineales bacterium]